MKPLAWMQCPECRDDGHQSVVQYEVAGDIIETLQCRRCGYEDNPGEFNR